VLSQHPFHITIVKRCIAALADDDDDDDDDDDAIYHVHM
jgi:hypothetical protein